MYSNEEIKFRQKVMEHYISSGHWLQTGRNFGYKIYNLYDWVYDAMYGNVCDIEKYHGYYNGKY